MLTRLTWSLWSCSFLRKSQQHLHFSVCRGVASQKKQQQERCPQVFCKLSAGFCFVGWWLFETRLGCSVALGCHTNNRVARAMHQQGEFGLHPKFIPKVPAAFASGPELVAPETWRNCPTYQGHVNFLCFKCNRQLFAMFLILIHLCTFIEKNIFKKIGHTKLSNHSSMLSCFFAQDLAIRATLSAGVLYCAKMDI